MTLGEHAMVGALASFLGPRQRWGWPATVMTLAAACAPDVDALFWFGNDFETYGQLHRCVAHSVPGLIVLALLLTAFWRWAIGLRGFGLLFVTNLLAAATNPLLDMLYGWPPVQFFWPFSQWGWSVEVLHFGDLVPLVLLIAPCIWVYRRPASGRPVAAAFLAALTGYIVLRALLPQPDWPPLRFITGQWIQPVYDWIGYPG